MVEQQAAQSGAPRGSQEKYCTACGGIAEPERRTKGSFLLEFVLWMLVLVPGLLYARWRLSTSYQACPLCGGASLVPAFSATAARGLRSRALARAT